MKGFASLIAVSSACFAMLGCVIVQESPQPAPPPAAPGPAKPQTVDRPHANGRPQNLASNGPSAFWIWHDGNGRWEIRTTTPGTQHQFYGRVVGHNNAKITSARSLRTEVGDKVRYDPKLGTIGFDFSTAGGVDGIEFVVEGKCVDFNLRINGQEQPQHIVVGAREERPTSAKFTACP